VENYNVDADILWLKNWEKGGWKITKFKAGKEILRNRRKPITNGGKNGRN
jgi:hypothetical protein